VRIAVFLRAKPGSVEAQVSSTTEEIVRRLREGGAEVDLIVAEARAWDLAKTRPEHDLYVLKSKTRMTLRVAGALAAGGARLVNSYESSRLAKDKVLHTALLANAGVPLPRSWAVASRAGLEELLERRKCAAFLAKPPSGSMAKGICRLVGVDDLAGAEARELIAALDEQRPVLVMEEVPSDGLDLKLYVVGDWIAAIRRPFPARTDAEKRGEPAEVPAPIRDAALACGRALGLELYGVDVLTDDGRFRVVDVNAFPSYKGIEGGPRRVAEHLLR
jgi:ribosomal protein S6--L-glutamate ligase